MNREAKFGVLLRHWFKSQRLPTCALELKQTTSDSLPFSDVKQAQLDYAEAINTSPDGVMIRVSAWNGGEPDYIWLFQEPAYLVIKYPKCFVLISWQIFEREKRMSSRKSLTIARAREIAEFMVSI